MEKLINDFKISFTKGDTYALAVKFKNIAEDLRCAYFTVKENPEDAPLIQKSLGAGIDKIDDREYKAEKTYKVQLQSVDTIYLEANVQYLYDLQVTLDNVVKTVLSGVFVVNHSVSGATSTITQMLEVAVENEVEAEILTTPATNGVEYEQDPVACAQIGKLEQLKTVAKETVVQAVNEAYASAQNSEARLDDIIGGDSAVPFADEAEYANEAQHAKTADNATNADHAQHAMSAGTSVNADHATEADHAKNADKAGGWFSPTYSGEEVGEKSLPLYAKYEVEILSNKGNDGFGGNLYGVKCSGEIPKGKKIPCEIEGWGDGYIECTSSNPQVVILTTYKTTYVENTHNIFVPLGVVEAKYAVEAGYAEQAEYAREAEQADHATNADKLYSVWEKVYTHNDAGELLNNPCITKDGSYQICCVVGEYMALENNRYTRTACVINFGISQVFLTAGNLLSGINTITRDVISLTAVGGGDGELIYKLVIGSNGAIKVQSKSSIDGGAWADVVLAQNISFGMSGETAETGYVMFRKIID